MSLQYILRDCPQRWVDVAQTQTKGVLPESYELCCLNEKRSANILSAGDWILPTAGLGFLIWLPHFPETYSKPGFSIFFNKLSAYSCEIKCYDLRSGCFIQWEINVCYLLLSQGLYCLVCTYIVLPIRICNLFGIYSCSVTSQLKY